MLDGLLNEHVPAAKARCAQGAAEEGHRKDMFPVSAEAKRNLVSLQRTQGLIDLGAVYVTLDRRPGVQGIGLCWILMVMS